MYGRVKRLYGLVGYVGGQEEAGGGIDPDVDVAVTESVRGRRCRHHTSNAAPPNGTAYFHSWKN